MVEDILVTVRTYPNISAKYVETVCTGGIERNTLQWRRLYPVPLRYLDEDQKYRTYDVIRVDVRDGKDGRAETRTPDNTSIEIVTRLTKWSSRHDWVGPTIVDSLQELESKGKSIAPVRVSKVLDFTAEEIVAEWTEAEKQKLAQEQLFDARIPLEKIPYHFRILWRDTDGIEHRNRFQAWEVGETWRRYRKEYDDPISIMRDKWLNDLCSQDREVSFFMGNLARFRQNWMVCGIYNPPKKEIPSHGTLFK